MQKKIKVALMLVSLCCIQGYAQATIYSWVSKNGVVTYGDRPPASTSHATVIHEYPAPASTPVTPGISAHQEKINKTKSSHASPVTPARKKASLAQRKAINAELAVERAQLLQDILAYKKGEQRNRRNYATYEHNLKILKNNISTTETYIATLEYQLAR